MSDPLRILLHHSDADRLATQVRQAHPDAQVCVCTTYADLPALIDRFRPQVVYSVRFAGTAGFPVDALLGPNGPKWIANGGVGTDHFGHWETSRTTVTNAAGVAAGMMAEYILGGFLHFTLDVPGLQADKATRLWANRMVRSVAGQSLLIIGLGQTGQALASRAKALGMYVLGTRATPRAMPHVDEVHGAEALLSLLPRADFIALATPLTASTRGLIGTEEIAAMKPGVILADVSRGGVVDQQALHTALAKGHVAAAVLDVFEVEPLPETSPLWDAPNVLISPHCASVHPGWHEDSYAIFLDNLGRWVRGEPLRNVVDPERGY